MSDTTTPRFPLMLTLNEARTLLHWRFGEQDPSWRAELDDDLVERLNAFLGRR